MATSSVLDQCEKLADRFRPVANELTALAERRSVLSFQNKLADRELPLFAKVLFTD